MANFFTNAGRFLAYTASPWQTGGEKDWRGSKLKILPVDPNTTVGGGIDTGVYGAQTTTPQYSDTASDGSSYGSGSSSYGSGSSSSSTAQAAAQRSAFMKTLQQKWATLGSVLNDIYGTIDTVTKDKAQSLADNYATQENQLAKDYASTSGATNSAYAGRGLADSSYLGEAQDANMNTYNDTLNSLAQDKQSKYAELGQYAAGQKAGVDAMRQQYNPIFQNLGQYDDSTLQSVGSSLDSSLASANSQKAGLGTDSQFIQQLNGITPITQQGSVQLQARLQNLVSSTAPASAKRQIAKGFIKAATVSDPTQANYWTSTFDQMLANSGQ